MSQKESQKKLDIFIEEDKDVYLSFLNKKLRNARKKLEQIDDLMKRDASNLKTEQIEKINSKGDVVQNIKHFEDLKDLYYSAFKAENKQLPKESSIDKNSRNTEAISTHQSSKDSETAAMNKGNENISEDKIIESTLRKIFNLISISQLLGKSSQKEEFIKIYENENKDTETLKRTNIDILQQFYTSTFDFLESSLSVKASDKLTQSLEKLKLYVKGDENPAAGGITYKYLQEIIEKIANNLSFQNTTFPYNTATNVSQERERGEEKSYIKPEHSPNEESSVAAAILKPDIDDFVKSPEKGRFIPKEFKVARFVDEIEKDMLSAQIRERNQETSSHSSEERIQVAKESREPYDQNQEVEGRQEAATSLGLSKKRPTNEFGDNRTKRAQSNKAYNNQKRFANDGQKGYGKTGHSNTKYQYKEYVEKRPKDERQ